MPNNLFLLNSDQRPTLVYEIKTLKILDVNNLAEERYGYSREEFLKMSIRDLRPPSELPKLDEAIKKPKGLASYVYPEAFIHKKKTGELMVVEISSQEIHYQDKSCRLVYIYDVTEREKIFENLHKKEQELEEANIRYGYVIKATSDAIWDWDLQTDQVFWGEGYETTFGYVLDKNQTYIAAWKDHVHPDDLQRVILSLKNAQNNSQEMWEEEYRYLRSDHTYANVVDKAFVIRNKEGIAIRMVGAMQDITKIKESEILLQQLNTQLQQQAKHLTEANMDLEQFAYVASHDLNEPLRMVKSFLDLLKQKCQNQLDDKAKVYINYAVDGAMRMEKLIKDLLEYSLSGVDQYLKSTDLNVVLEEVKKLLEYSITQKSATIDVSELPTLVINMGQIEQIFQNLISNALKYCNDDKKPYIKIKAFENDKEWTFSVADNGIGIPMKHKDDIFKLFKRLKGRDQNSGSGIGLSICKKLVERSSGRIWVESKEELGSTFFFTLPKIKQQYIQG